MELGVLNKRGGGRWHAWLLSPVFPHDVSPLAISFLSSVLYLKHWTAVCVRNVTTPNLQLQNIIYQLWRLSYNIKIVAFLFYKSASVFPFMWVKLASRLAMPAGNFTVSSMGFSRMDRCPVIRQSVEGTTPSTLSSARQELASMYPEQCL